MDLFLFFSNISQSVTQTYLLRHIKKGYKKYKVLYFFSTLNDLGMFFNCFFLYYYRKETLVLMKNFETVVMEIHFAFDTHAFRVFLQILHRPCFSAGRIKHRRKHASLKPSSFVIDLHHQYNISKRLFSQSFF